MEQLELKKYLKTYLTLMDWVHDDLKLYIGDDAVPTIKPEDIIKAGDLYMKALSYYADVVRRLNAASGDSQQNQ